MALGKTNQLALLIERLKVCVPSTTYKMVDVNSYGGIYEIKQANTTISFMLKCESTKIGIDERFTIKYSSGHYSGISYNPIPSIEQFCKMWQILGYFSSWDESLFGHKEYNGWVEYPTVVCSYAKDVILDKSIEGLVSDIVEISNHYGQGIEYTCLNTRFKIYPDQNTVRVCVEDVAIPNNLYIYRRISYVEEELFPVTLTRQLKLNRMI
jgi:hypothetical protein